MKRGGGPTADPEKTRAWQQRSRERAAANAVERAQGREGMRSTELRRSVERQQTRFAGPVPRWSPEWQREYDATKARIEPLEVPAARVAKHRGRVQFKARRPARGQRCVMCSAAGRSRGASSWHHWLPQEHIRVYARGQAQALGWGKAEHDRRLSRLLKDERNLSPVCAACHDRHEHPGVDTERFAAHDVPPTAHEFAAELGPEWAERLLRTYPAAGDSRNGRSDGGT